MVVDGGDGGSDGDGCVGGGVGGGDGGSDGDGCVGGGGGDCGCIGVVMAEVVLAVLVVGDIKGSRCIDCDNISDR